MTFSNLCNEIFWKSTTDYHVTDSVDAPMNNPYELKSIEYYLYLKNWIDAVQWHFEDIIRDPQIDPVAALALKRRIDKSNQDRTDLVELIDSYFLDKYKEVKPLTGATINTESPAWAIDRLSILALKIYHMQQEVERTDTTEEHRAQCQIKLNILLEQRKDLSSAIDQLLADIEVGNKYMKVHARDRLLGRPHRAARARARRPGRVRVREAPVSPEARGEGIRGIVLTAGSVLRADDAAGQAMDIS